MMKKNLSFAKRAICLFVVVLLLIGCAACAKKISYADLPISHMEADFAYDPSDIRQVIGVNDYVFVGKVEAEVETRYLQLTSYYDPDTGEEIPFGLPHTVYTVQVQENIKGELISDEPIEIVKDGGVSMDKNYILLYYNDAMPEPGKTYIFSAFGQSTGDLLVSGPRSNVEVPDGEEGEVLIEEYRTAYENQVIPKGWTPTGNVSRYDVSEAGK